MSLERGTRLGPYEIESVLGAGGMGEVYRAHDTRLKRDVAIKVLPAAFAQDPDRIARLQREAEVLATLNHPNIAAVYGFEESADATGIVLELVEGPTLADRIAHGALPIDEALTIARQIADALDAAHDKNIVHRDLKPANVKVTPGGKVKVLDFGLAKMADAEPARGSSLSMSPTLAVQATSAGLILGTAGYMSPEQARGKAVDRRTDIWSFGCVLYEMLTGRPCSSGRDRVGRGCRDSDERARLEGAAADVARADPQTPSPLSREGSRPSPPSHRRRAARDRRCDERTVIEEMPRRSAPTGVDARRAVGGGRSSPWRRGVRRVGQSGEPRFRPRSRQAIGADASAKRRNVHVESHRRRIA